MAKEPIAGQPDVFDANGFTDKLIDLLFEFKAEDTLDIPDHITAVYMWNQAVMFSETMKDLIKDVEEDEVNERDSN